MIIRRIYFLLIIVLSLPVYGRCYINGNCELKTNSPGEEVIEQWSGSCIAIGKNLVATNYHVVDNADNLFVTGFKGDKNTKYRAEVLLIDKINDLAVMRIVDDRFTNFNIKYGIKNTVSDIGTSVFVLGYPLTMTMGDDIKLTTGVISSKSGFQGNISQYQISAPIQPGNSGGPLFDDNGNLIGIVSAKHLGAENVSYAIKLVYLRNLLDSSVEPIPTDFKNSISNYSLPDKVKAISSCVLMVLASSYAESSRDSQQGKINSPKPEIKLGEDANAIIAHKYMVAGDEIKAYECFMKADINKLNQSQLNEFVRCSYFTGHFEDGLRAAEAGIKLEPRNPTFNRLAMFCNYELKNYDAAKDYIYKYFNETDNAIFSEYDHFYASLTYYQLHEFQKSLLHCERAMDLLNESSMIKRWDLLKTASDIQLGDGKFDSAIEYYKEYMKCKPNLNADDYDSYANIYIKYAESDENKKSEMIEMAVKIYREMGKKFPNQLVYATYMSASAINKLDNNMEESLAKKDYQKVIDLLSKKKGRTNGEDKMLKTAYHYMMFNSYVHKNIEESKEYARKILEIDPEYEAAYKVLDL